MIKKVVELLILVTLIFPNHTLAARSKSLSLEKMEPSAIVRNNILAQYSSSSPATNAKVLSAINDGLAREEGSFGDALKRIKANFSRESLNLTRAEAFEYLKGQRVTSRELNQVLRKLQAIPPDRLMRMSIADVKSLSTTKVACSGVLLVDCVVAGAVLIFIAYFILDQAGTFEPGEMQRDHGDCSSADLQDYSEKYRMHFDFLTKIGAGYGWREEAKEMSKYEKVSAFLRPDIWYECRLDPNAPANQLNKLLGIQDSGYGGFEREADDSESLKRKICSSSSQEAFSQFFNDFYGSDHARYHFDSYENNSIQVPNLGCERFLYRTEKFTGAVSE